MHKLKQELAKKKEEHLKTSRFLKDADDRKFIKNGELEALKKRLNQLSDASKGHEQINSSDALVSKDGYDDQHSASMECQEEHRRRANLTRKEVVRRLREREEPIRLFGETDYEAFMRLKNLEMLEPEVNKGFKNDFQDAMDKVDENYTKEMIRSVVEENNGSLTEDVTVEDDGTTYEEVLGMSENLGRADQKLDSQVILKYLSLVLKIWGDELNKRSDDVKRSRKGKIASATHVQTVNYIEPLFKKLKKSTLPEDIFSCLVDIVKSLVERDYLKANEAYLEMAIGNAPWPIGVTMVGIHARTGREKISARNVAHVLNDETQRKYIQALKRLMTQAQKYFPTDPSRSINYTPQRDEEI